MIVFTPQERRVLAMLVCVLVAGSGLDYLGKVYPFIWQVANLTDNAVLYPKVDLNTASLDALVKVPALGPVLAGRIIDYRRQHGAFKAVDDLLAVPGILPKTLEHIRPYLEVR